MTSKLALGMVCATLAMGVVACEKKQSPKPPTSGAGNKSMTDSVKDAAKSAGEKVDEVAKEAKEKAVAAAQGLYDSAKKEYDALAAKVSSSSSPEKPVWEQAADAVKSNLADAEKKLEDLKSSSDWKKINDELSALMAKVNDGIKSLSSQVK